MYMSENQSKNRIPSLNARPVVLHSWSGFANFGDELSRYIVSKITSRPIIINEILQEKIERGHLYAIGSILREFVLYEGAYIWGSGCLDPETFGSRRLHRMFPLNRGTLRRICNGCFKRSKILALRGPLTYELIKASGFPASLYSEPCTYGDPGILMPLFYTPPPT